eukprot:CAMPEP_0119330640 /NCGR_PEP_ID=MMETSP1333-20130426/78681_1 /TAXON_ID=418940 /ORGANISM="Scyphosphaera apsteinii, Strain RCC1455" /LENGTH=231 /DNA_ID=CAMNT_0007340053 /DNA_START=48 /DNA_END=743 /DNA_ORIENTATION=-
MIHVSLVCAQPDDMHTQAATTIIQKNDGNRDGQMSAAELRKSGMIAGLGISREDGSLVEPIEALRALDTDKSGQVSVTELAAFIRQMHSRKDSGDELVEHAQVPMKTKDEDDDSAEEDVLWAKNRARKRKPGEAQPPRNKKPTKDKNDWLPPEVKAALGGRNPNDLASLLPEQEQEGIRKRRMARGERIPEPEVPFPEDDPADKELWESKSKPKRKKPNRGEQSQKPREEL